MYTQEHRQIAITTELGDDKLLLSSVSGSEGISRLFRFSVQMFSNDDAIDLDALIGTNATFRIDSSDGSPHYFNGYFSRISQGSRQDEFSTYDGELVPYLWFLTRKVQSRVFPQKRTTPQIIQQIFSEYGYQDYALRLYGEFEEREFCVQYRESDFNFISRLLEEEGIFYYFEHENGKHKLVLANSASDHKPCPGQSKVRLEKSGAQSREDDVITEWRMQRNLQPGAFALNDFNFETPSANLRVDATGKAPFEIYDFPGGYRTRSAGDQLVRVRLQEVEAGSFVGSGSSDCRSFATGYKFQFQEHYRSDQNGWYVLTNVQHTAQESGEFRTGSAAGSVELRYTNTFECIALTTPFRPPRVTPRPVIQGSQSAFVVGPESSEIYTDKYGRIKVQFHWDREHQLNEDSSCWIRVAQLVAGKQWGAIFLPRVGQEVLVNFMEGDPDRPVVTGSLYNAEQMPPYDLPDASTKSTFKSRSSPGGDGFNELRFEDKKGSEQIFIHAERDFETRTKNDFIQTILGEKHLKTTKDQMEAIDGDFHRTVKGDENLKVSGTLSIQAAEECHAKIGSTFALESGSEIHLKAGMNLVIESGMTLTLKVGGNFVSIGPAGVAISGTTVLINSGGSAGSGANCSPEDPKPPKVADDAKSGDAVVLKRTPPVKPVAYSPQAVTLKQAASTGTPFCAICELKKLARQGLL